MLVWTAFKCELEMIYLFCFVWASTFTIESQNNVKLIGFVDVVAHQ